MAVTHVNMNKADLDELSQIPGIGKQRAHFIIKYRSEHGPYKNWEDFDNVPGISKGMIQQIKRSGATLK